MIRKTISMPDKMGEWITARVESGQYGNESEYIRDLVRYDQEQRGYIEYVSRRVAEGEAAIAAGDYVDLETKEDIENFFDEFKREGGL